MSEKNLWNRTILRASRVPGATACRARRPSAGLEVKLEGESLADTLRALSCARQPSPSTGSQRRRSQLRSDRLSPSCLSSSSRRDDELIAVAPALEEPAGRVRAERAGTARRVRLIPSHWPLDVLGDGLD